MAAAFNMASLLGALEETKSLIQLQDEQIKAKQRALQLSQRRRSGTSREENRIKENIEKLEKRLKSLHDNFDRKSRVLERRRRQGNSEMSNNSSSDISELRQAMDAIETQSGALVSEIKVLYDALSNLAESAAAAKQEQRQAEQHARALQREADARFASDLEFIIGKMNSGMSRRNRSRSRSPRYSRSRSRSRSPRRGGATRRRQRK
jgi:chromosome segregation ATPase